MTRATSAASRRKQTLGEGYFQKYFLDEYDRHDTAQRQKSSEISFSLRSSSIDSTRSAQKGIYEMTFKYV